ncbi:MAG: YihY family inner membrane protein [Ignavibacteriales bacterium]|nr:YihY family inner membrane protein [Ignavibacteriales bacterium]
MSKLIRRIGLYRQWRFARFRWYMFTRLPKVAPVVKYVRSFYKHYVIVLIDRLDRQHAFLLAAAIAFTFIICVIPLSLLIFWAAGFFLSSSLVESQIYNAVDTLVPYYRYADFVKVLISRRLDEIVEYQAVAGYLGLIGLLFASSIFFGTIRTALNTVFFARADVNVFVAKLRDFAFVFALIILLLVFAVALPIIDFLREASSEIPLLGVFDLPLFHQAATTGFTFAVIFVVSLFLYMAAPVRKIRWISACVGAAWTAALWAAAKEAFGYYIYNLAVYGKIYGAYAALIVVAFWIYYSGVIFIVGAVVGQIFNERREMKYIEKFESGVF